jgi:hypothetical protein
MFPPAPTTFSPQVTKAVDKILATRMKPGGYTDYWITGDTEAALAARLAKLPPASELITKTLAAILARRPDLVGQHFASGWRALHEHDPVHMISDDTVLWFCISAVGKVPVFVMHTDQFEECIESYLDDCFEELED